MLMEAGLALGIVGALVVAIGAWRFLLDPSGSTSTHQRWWTLIGSVVIGLGFFVQLAGRLESDLLGTRP